MNDIPRKLAAARTRLILDKPFLGALVLRLPLKEAHGNWCTTSATDARSLYYNAEYISSLSLSQVQFVLAHEALHCGLSHFARRQHRDLQRWNLACDHAVNPLLVEDGLELPPGALYNERYIGMSAEEIYPTIERDSSETTMDEHLYDGFDNDSTEQQTDNRPDDREPEQQPPNRTGNNPADQETSDNDRSDRESKRQSQGSQQRSDINKSPDSDGDGKQNNNQSQNELSESTVAAHSDNEQSENRADNQTQNDSKDSVTGPPPPLSVQEREQLNIQWQQRLAGAAQQASQAGKMNGSVARLIARLLRSTIPWRTLLARFMSGTSRVDYNWTRPSHRRGGDAIMPSLFARETNVLVAVDTSGSIEQDELDVFITEVNAIKGLVNARITLLACDATLDKDGPWVYESWEQLTLPKTLRGGGGTSFIPVFEWINNSANQPDLVVYFTDAQGRFPSQPPAMETLWLVKGSLDVPWGQRIQLN